MFNNLCKEGGEISFKEIAIKYNLLTPFNEQDIKKSVKFLEVILKRTL